MDWSDSSSPQFSIQFRPMGFAKKWGNYGNSTTKMVTSYGTHADNPVE